ncbi:stage III sporulation protein AG [Ruminiclostridium sufflavum DSM 19573]|uniref:Stage III sporulation protein AG n=1 Tax=Ruminiclostridium sufflavum DSM 19573 TaxID=1121337 RepID=A0A318XI02_9FIRM|nr:stage III sporulation protein AG [Ruminiclostridium sufflavum]PYG86815.1 stage III sporulation protein AG [Ruminiclostridium sufflavum DSM 19573]
MLKKFLEKAKQIFTKNGSRKFIERAAIVALIGVMFLIAGSVLFEKNPRSSLESGTSSNTLGNTEVKTGEGAVETLNQTEKNLKNETELRLKAILSQISGAGKVDVMITFYSGNEFIPAADVNTSENDTQEKDKEGGSRVIKQTDKESTTIYQEVDGVKKPFIIKEILPKVKGVVVVADGAADAEVKADLVKATEALLDIAVHKIQVFQRDSN